MTPERWQQIKQVFSDAMMRPTNNRAVFLSEACANDEDLFREVEDLLAAHDDTESHLLDESIGAIAAKLFDEDKPKIRPGEQLGHYKIISEIGGGGMGEVYLAKDARLGRRVALKLLPQALAQDESFVRRFRQEARAASALNHPNIVIIHEIVQIEETHFIASEFIEGQTLRDRLEQSDLTIAETLDIAIQITGALAAAHKVGIVHRDIKPENIMLRPDGYVKVLDFGLAKLTDYQSITTQSELNAFKVKTEPGLILGTITRMSPEQARGQEVDGRSDLFSFGVTLYEMLTGQVPFRGQGRAETVAAILHSQPERPSLHKSDIPHELERIVLKTLRKDREERYQTAQDLQLELKRLQQEISQAARTQDSNQSIVQQPPDKRNQARRTATGKGQTIWVRRKMIGLGLLLLIVLLLILLLSRQLW